MEKLLHYNLDWIEVIGWIGTVIFSCRFLVQWHATEKRKQVVVPMAFWWLSLLGSLTLLAFNILHWNLVMIVAYAFNWIPYLRNLVIHKRHDAAQKACGDCRQVSPPQAHYCAQCGSRFATAPATASLAASAQ